MFTFFTAELRPLLRIALPILIAQLVTYMMGTVDALMAGRVGAEHLAAVALGQSIWQPITLLCFGVLLAVPTMTANHLGAKQFKAVGDLFRQSFWLSFFSSVVGAIAILALVQVAQSQAQEPLLASLVDQYLSAIVWGLPALGIFNVLRCNTEGLGDSRPSMWMAIIALLCNIPLNYMFIYGKWGAPAMGGAGCGVATAICYWIMLVGLLLQTRLRSFYQPYDLFRWQAPHWRQISQLLAVGLPMGLAFFFEVSLFALVALLIAPLGAIAVASHQIAINISGLIFMIPLSLGVAVSIQMGLRMGQDKPRAVLRVLVACLFFGTCITLVSATAVLLFRFDLPNLYTADLSVLTLAATLLILSVIYQFVDMVQVICAGALRAFKDGRSIFLITFVAYWLVGLPVGYVIAMTDLLVPAKGAVGFWWGFIAGLATAAIGLSLRLLQQFRQLFAPIAGRS